MTSKTGHKIKHRSIVNDVFYTPEPLAKYLISLVDIKDYDVLYDAFAGQGVFYNNYPKVMYKCYTEIKEGTDFFECTKHVDWIVTNPPYSILDKVLNKSCIVCHKGFAYLIGINNLTPKRIEACNKQGFGLTKIHLCKVFKWYGMSAFCVFEKGKQNCIEYDRKVWR